MTNSVFLVTTEHLGRIYSALCAESNCQQKPCDVESLRLIVACARQDCGDGDLSLAGFAGVAARLWHETLTLQPFDERALPGINGRVGFLACEVFLDLNFIALNLDETSTVFLSTAFTTSSVTHSDLSSFLSGIVFYRV